MADSVSLTELHIASVIADNKRQLQDIWHTLQDWRSGLEEMKNYLVGLEGKKGIAHNEQVRAWFSELREIAYEAEDEVDSCVLESMSQFRLPCRDKKASRQLRLLVKEIRLVKARLEAYVQDISDSPRVREGWSQLRVSQPDHEDNKYVVGIHADVKMLVQQLVSNSVFGLAIVGMGGSGKTTLAWNIYNDRWIRNWYFKYQVWVVLSQFSDASAVLFEILQQISGDGILAADEQGHGLPEVLGTQIRNLLRRKTCLLVLDEVWESESIGEILSVLFPPDDESARAQIKVIITSRAHFLPVDTRLQWHVYHTQQLSEEDSWTLLDKMASKDDKGIDRDCHVLAMEMLRKCQGLPLAIVALGQHLKTKETILEWEKMYSEMEGPEGAYLYRSVNNILGISYDWLPYYLKPCFLYLGLFPKGSRISAGRLIRMWVAEGFVPKPTENDQDTMEDKARRYLQGLINHNMIQVVRTSYAEEVKAVQVHAFMWDFCVMVAQQLHFVIPFSPDSDLSSRYTRRTAINLSTHMFLPDENSYIRTLMLYGEPSAGNARTDRHAKERNQVALNMAPICENSKLVRVLDLTGIKTSDCTLPEEIGCFIHLRYLRIRSTNIRGLPKSIGKLQNLLTLDYWDVSVDSGVTLPNVLWKLKCLRYLFLPNEMTRVKGELKLHTMKDLQVLWGIGGGNWMLKEMKILSSSLKKLYIQGISSLEQIKAVFSCPAIEEDHLRALALDWYGFDLQIPESLCLKNNLRKLRLMGKATDQSEPLKFPCKLEKLELYFTQLQNSGTMSALGRLSCLKSLRLSKESYVGQKWICNQGAFPVLKELKLSQLKSFSEWEIEEGGMPCLKKLSIVSCMNLRGIPVGLKSIHTLEELELERMSYGFCSRLRQIKEGRTTITGQDFDIVKHIPSIKIIDACSSRL